MFETETLAEDSSNVTEAPEGDEKPVTPQQKTGREDESAAAAADAEPEAGENRPDGRRERARHYNRQDIRKYMAKQKQIRKQSSDSPKAFVCNHTRSSPMRIDTGNAARRKPTSVSRKPVAAAEQAPMIRIPQQEENWGPYESPKTLPLPAFPAPEVIID